MVIKSSFKDYYDFVANQYGGGDPRLVYERGPFSDEQLRTEIDDWKLMDPTRYWHIFNYEQMEHRYLVIAGKAYLLIRTPHIYYYQIANDLEGYKIQDPNKENKKLPKWMTYQSKIEFGKEDQSLVELCRKIKAPVFIIDRISYLKGRRAEVSINKKCPILSRFGVPALINPYQMYQDLSMFMGNKMKECPDTRPPVELGNKQKIVKAGFDVVQSFRHRK